MFSPLEFENFARDMIQIRENIIFESFADGKDGGIDARYIDKDGATTILQAKRLKNMNTQILSIMKKEKRKMDKLVQEGKRIDRYILALSEDIGRKRKDEILNLMSSYIKSPDDIVMQKDFNNLISMQEYKEIEAKYYQLWLPSANVLNTQLFKEVNRALLERSRICYEEMVEKKDIFVQTEIFNEIINNAKKSKTVIISGEPGVGKTMLAEQAALYYLGKMRSKIFFVISSMQELYTALAVGGKKVILYDDFWGSNGLEEFKVMETSGELVKIIERLRGNKDCILFMTTREYVLEQGLQKNAELRKLISKYKIECHITSYSEADKLQIYYGHIKAAGLTWQQTNALIENDYRVIYSTNYNPRVLAGFVSLIETNMDPDDCVEKLHDYLENPQDFWKNIFGGLSREAKILFVIMATMPLPLEIKYLRECYNHYLENKEDAYAWKSFSNTIAELEKTVTRTDLYNARGVGKLVVTFQNPSVKDFLIAFLKENYIQYRQVIENSCQYYAQYMEYLKLLNEIGVSVEIYRNTFVKAIEALKTESITFYDKYRTILEYNNELDKYYDNFRTMQGYRDIGYGRFFQLLIMYRSGCENGIKDKMNRLFFSIMSDISKYPENVLDEDLRMIPDTIITAYETGICNDIVPMLEIYMDILMRNRKSINNMKIAHAFPEVWKKYVESHRKQIGDYLDKYFEAELCVTAVEDDGEEYVYQVMLCEESYEEYNMEIPQELKNRINFFNSWVEEDREEDEEDFQESAIRKNIAEIKEEFEEDFLNTIFPEDIENIEQWLLQNDSLEEVKKSVREIEQAPSVLWSRFLKNEDAMEFLTKFIEFFGEIPKSVLEAIEKINEYIQKKSGLTRKELLEVEYRLQTIGTDHFGWSYRQLEETFSDLLFEKEDFLNDMVEANILVNRYHWYRWADQCLPLCIQLAEKLCEKNKRIEYYKTIRQETYEKKLDFPSEFLMEILHQVDAESFEKYILIPAANQCYKNFNRENEGWMKEMLSFIAFEYEFENNEVVGGSYYADINLDIVQIYLQIDLFNDIEEMLEGESMEKLQKAGLLENGKATITLIEIEEKGLLKDLKVYEKLRGFWEGICKWKGEV